MRSFFNFLVIIFSTLASADAGLTLFIDRQTEEFYLTGTVTGSFEYDLENTPPSYTPLIGWEYDDSIARSFVSSFELSLDPALVNISHDDPYFDGELSLDASNSYVSASVGGYPSGEILFELQLDIDWGSSTRPPTNVTLEGTGHRFSYATMPAINKELLVSMIGKITNDLVDGVGLGQLAILDGSAPAVVESNGNTSLLGNENGYYAGSVDTPLVYGGTQISGSTYAGYTALGVDLVNGAYRVVLFNGSQYSAANFSLSGSNSSTWAVVANVPAEEVKLQQDLNSDGYVGIAPPASLAGKQIEYQPSGGETSSVPWQELYGSDGNAQFGFSGSVIERIPYTYAQGVVTYTIFSEEIRLSFETATSGTYEYVEIDGVDLFVDEVGTFSIVAPTLEVKADDWQRSETMDSSLSTDYWNIARRTVDGVAYNAGELSFIFANGGEPGVDDYPEIDIEYGRTLPLDENWQVVLDDLGSSVSDFRIGFDLSFLDPDSEVDCSFSYGDYGFGGRQVNADVERRGDTYVYSAGAFVRANQDARLQGGVNLRVRHNAASRDLLFEYQPDGASGWTELARLNLGDGTFAGTNQYGDGVAPISGEVISASERFAMDVEVEAGQATQLGDLEIAGIEIGSYTPPVWELYDDFSGSVLDTQKWETWYWPGGQAPVVTNGQLKLENGGGSGRKEAAFMNTLQSAGIDLSSETYHSGVAFTDPSIIGVEADLYLPAGVVAESGVIIDLFEQVSSQEIRNAGVELSFWGGSQAVLEFAKSAYSSGTRTSKVEHEDYVTLGQTYRIRILRQDGSIKLYADDVLVQTHDAEGELLAFFIVAFNDVGQSMYATVDNVRVLRDTTIEPPLPVVESYGNTDLLEDDSGYYAGSEETPLVYQGAQFSSRTYAGFTALGVDLVNGTYRVVLYNGSQYYAANFSLSGSSSNAWALVSDILVEEVNLQQDLDDDGYVGTPPVQPPASLAGLELNHGDGVSYFDSQGVYYGGIQDGYISEKGSWEYYVSDYKGILILDKLTHTQGGYKLEVELRFSSPTAGSYQVFEVYDVRPEQANFTGNFTLGARTLLDSVHPDWQYREDFGGDSLDSALWSPYTDSGRDEIAVANGLVSVLIDSQSLESDTWAGLDSLRVLPMSESWEVQTRVVADVNRLAGVNNYEIGILLSNYDSVGSGGFEINLEDYGLSAGVINRTSPWDAFRHAYTNALPGLASAHLRIVHDSNTSVVSLAYDVDGATNGWDWEPLIEYQLSDGSGTRWIDGIPEPFNGGTWTLGQDDYLRVDLEAHVGGINGTYNAQAGDLGFDYFEVGSYTPPPTPVDSDDDGLDDSVETNTGVYVSPSDTGTDPNKADSSGDLFTDGEVVSLGLDPNVDYSGLLAIVRNNPDRFEFDDSNSTVDMRLRGLRLGRADNGGFNMNFDLEMSTDLQTWTPHTSHSIELSVPDQSKAFMRLNVK